VPSGKPETSPRSPLLLEQLSDPASALFFCLPGFQSQASLSSHNITLVTAVRISRQAHHEPLPATEAEAVPFACWRHNGESYSHEAADLKKLYAFFYLLRKHEVGSEQQGSTVVLQTRLGS
jgi:hypothetical protein